MIPRTDHIIKVSIRHLWTTFLFLFHFGSFCTFLTPIIFKLYLFQPQLLFGHRITWILLQIITSTQWLIKLNLFQVFFLTTIIFNVIFICFLVLFTSGSVAIITYNTSLFWLFKLILGIIITHVYNLVELVILG